MRFGNTSFKATTLIENKKIILPGIEHKVTVSLECVGITIRVITKLPNSEQAYKGKVKTHKYINRQNESTTGKL
jgi:hypothetical protein